MKTSSVSSTDKMQAAHLVMTRDKKAMTVMVLDGLVFVATLAGDKIDTDLYNSINGYRVTSSWLPLAAFDEILDMIISFGGH